MLGRDINYEAADGGRGDRSGQPQDFLRCLSVPHLIICAVGSDS